MFYVVYGYIGPDNYTSCQGPILRVKELATALDVTKFYEKFVRESAGPDNSSHEFRVIEGRERKLSAVKTVTEWKLD